MLPLSGKAGAYAPKEMDRMNGGNIFKLLSVLSKNFRLKVPNSIKTFIVLRKSILFTSLCLIRELRSEIINAIHEPKEGDCQWEVDTPEGRVLDAITDFKLGYFFCHLLVPKSTSFFTKEATEYQYEKSDEEAQEAGGEEKEHIRGKSMNDLELEEK
ncbi:hypothetical protein GH733_019308, partial [Mirounga leonina]